MDASLKADVEIKLTLRSSNFNRVQRGGSLSNNKADVHKDVVIQEHRGILHVSSLNRK